MADDQKDHTIIKLRKVVGQLQGVITMYEEKRSCLEVVQQVSAARSALSGIAKELLASEAGRCTRCQTPEDFDRILKSLLELS